jgi:hypothetical protein
MSATNGPAAVGDFAGILFSVQDSSIRFEGIVSLETFSFGAHAVDF